MLLVLDLGNTNIVAGIYRGPTPLRSWRIATDRAKTVDEYALLLSALLRSSDIYLPLLRDSILSSVVPPLTPVLLEAVEHLLGRPPMVVGPHLDLGIKVKVRYPEEVGADRLVNAVAGFAALGGPLLIVDSGTACTVDAVSHKGEYLGGAILPGIQISMEALVSRTAKLPRIDMVKPRRAIGDDTIEAMRSGIYYGCVGQLKELIRILGKELGGKPRVIATGGLSGWIPAREVGIEKILPDLTLEGLRLLYDRNRKPARR